MQNSPLSTPPHLAFACPQAKQTKEFFNYKINLPTPNYFTFVGLAVALSTWHKSLNP